MRPGQTDRKRIAGTPQRSCAAPLFWWLANRFDSDGIALVTDERERDEAITISVGRFWASVVRVRVRVGVNLSRVSVRRSSKGREGQQWQLLFGRLAG